jgi:hypothetical protein
VGATIEGTADETATAVDAPEDDTDGESEV